MRYLAVVLAISCAFFATSANSATLSDSQITTLRNVAQADPTAAAYLAAGNDSGLREWFNAATSCVVWRTSLPENEITDTVSGEATSWNWTTYIGRSVAEKAAWDRMVGVRGYINPSLPQVRSGWADIFSGTAQTAVAMRDHLTALSKRTATKAEQVLSGSGSCTSASPSTMGWEGTIYLSDVQRIRGG